jgi:hypothetical protein
MNVLPTCQHGVLPMPMHPCCPPAGTSQVTVYGENWSAEKQTITMATTFSEWVAGRDANMTAETAQCIGAPLVARD